MVLIPHDDVPQMTASRSTETMHAARTALAMAGAHPPPRMSVADLMRYSGMERPDPGSHPCARTLCRVCKHTRICQMNGITLRACVHAIRHVHARDTRVLLRAVSGPWPMPPVEKTTTGRAASIASTFGRQILAS